MSYLYNPIKGRSLSNIVTKTKLFTIKILKKYTNKYVINPVLAEDNNLIMFHYYAMSYLFF